MDSSTTIVIIIAFFALISIAAFVIFQRRTRLSIKAPFGTGLELDGSNEPTPPAPGVTVRDATSREGGLVAEDSTGRGALAERVDTKDDILVSSSPPPERPDPNP